jgi:hypothetical protein
MRAGGLAASEPGWLAGFDRYAVRINFPFCVIRSR